MNITQIHQDVSASEAKQKMSNNFSVLFWKKRLYGKAEEVKGKTKANSFWSLCTQMHSYKSSSLVTMPHPMHISSPGAAKLIAIYWRIFDTSLSLDVRNA